MQGVFCRYYCSQNARKLGINGSATNLPDGTVRVILDTEDDELVNRFVRAVRENPHGFRFFGSISGVTVSEYRGDIPGDYNF